MDPKAVAAMLAFKAALADLDIEYIKLMQRMGCKTFRMYHI